MRHAQSEQLVKRFWDLGSLDSLLEKMFLLFERLDVVIREEQH